MPEVHWTQYLAALSTPTVAVFGSIIAYRQWRTAQNKLKLDLFEKRFVVYNAARLVLSTITTTGKITNEDSYKFLSSTREARWLLDDGISEYFDKVLWERICYLQTLQAELEGLPIGDARKQNIEQQREVKDWIREQHSVLDAKFASYLKIGH